MLGDAEDALQDTLLAAWQGLAGFEERASIRTWLYRIATNRCLNARRAASRRTAREWDIPGVEPPEPTRLGEVVWLEPFPDALLEDAAGAPPGPEARYEQAESISLAFVTALQVLPPRQLAVLILRDVLGFRASEVAGMLDSTVDSVTSLLKRARMGLGGNEPRRGPGGGPEAGCGGSAARRWWRRSRGRESADLDRLMALLTDDVFVSCRRSVQYEGAGTWWQFCAGLFGAVALRLVPSGQRAVSVRATCAPGGIRHGTGLARATLSG
jgi:RNA polymerase sigma-70 factor (ECF subfamily)